MTINRKETAVKQIVQEEIKNAGTDERTLLRSQI